MEYQAHGSDIRPIFAPSDITDYLIRFAATFNPNGETGIFWPQYDAAARSMLAFQDGNTSLALTTDTFREEQVRFVGGLAQGNPL